jgi:hypothetical protein
MSKPIRASHQGNNSSVMAVANRENFSSNVKRNVGKKGK